MSPLTSGLRLRERFTLRERIDVGGMSEVWRAEDEVLCRPVAVKVITTALAGDPILRAATWTEARTAARLTHPHVTQVYDYGQASLPNGTEVAYLVMELVEGQSLAGRLRFGPLPWRQAAEMGAQVAAALTAAHRIGLVHRDVKPGNVMLARTGAKVLDFGIAALAGSEPNGDGGRLVGTPGYAAPERLRPGSIVPESDVYALGVLLYESLVGHPPVAVTSWPEAAAAHQSRIPVPPPDVPGLPRRVRRLCMACLSRDPAERPTAGDVAKGLAAATGQPPPARDLSVVAGQPPTALPVPHTGNAIGSAPIPHPPTMIESGDLAWAAEPLPGRRLQPLMVWLIAAVVALGLTMTVLAATLSAGGPIAAAAKPAHGSTPTFSSPASSPASPSASASTLDVVDQLDATITDAVAAGRLDSGAAAQLRDRVNDLRDSLGKGKARKIAQDLQEEINKSVDDGSVDQPTADRLTALLQPLIRIA